MKVLTAKQRAVKERNDRIRAVYDSLPKGSWTLRDLSDMFGVSVTTVHYVLNGRPKNNGK